MQTETEKGKSYYCRKNESERPEKDRYQTPYSLTEELLDRERFGNGRALVAEPAAGHNAIVDVLLKHGYRNIYANDIKDGADFLEFKDRVPYLITNPPFSLAKEFIVQCEKVVAKKFALLLPLDYLHGQERYDLFWTNKRLPLPLARVYVLNRFPMFGPDIREDGTFTTGMKTYAWYIFEKRAREPVIRWIDIRKYVKN